MRTSSGKKRKRERGIEGEVVWKRKRERVKKT